MPDDLYRGAAAVPPMSCRGGCGGYDCCGGHECDGDCEDTMPDATEAAVERIMMEVDRYGRHRQDFGQTWEPFGKGGERNDAYLREALQDAMVVREAIHEELAAADRAGYVRALERVGCMWLSVCGRPDTCPRCKMLAEAGTTGPSQSG